MDTFTLVNHSALDNTMAEFAFHTENDVKYLQFGLLNAEDAGYITELEPHLYRLEVGFIKDKLVRDSVRITDTYNENLGLPIDRIPELTLGDEYEIGFNKLEDDKEQSSGLTQTQLDQITSAIQGLAQSLTNAAVTATIEAYTRQFTQSLLDKLNSIEPDAKDDQTPEEIRDALLSLTDRWIPTSAIQGLPVTTLKSRSAFNFHASISPFAIGYIEPIDEKWISHNNATIQRYGSTNNDLGSFQPTQLGNRKPLFITYVSSQNQVWIGDLVNNTSIRIHKYALDRTFGETIVVNISSSNLLKTGTYNPQTNQLWILKKISNDIIYEIYNLNGSLSYSFKKEITINEIRANTYIPAPINEMWDITNNEKINRWTPNGGYVGELDLSDIDPRITNPSGMAYIGDDQLMIGDVTSRLIHTFNITQSIT